MSVEAGRSVDTAFTPSRDQALLDDYHEARHERLVRALWCAGDPDILPNTCRYCGKHWRKWPGSQLDGHAACVVTDEFKGRLLAALKADPALTFERVAQLLGVTYSVVRAWTYPRRRSR